MGGRGRGVPGEGGGWGTGCQGPTDGSLPRPGRRTGALAPNPPPSSSRSLGAPTAVPPLDPPLCSCSPQLRPAPPLPPTGTPPHCSASAPPPPPAPGPSLPSPPGEPRALGSGVPRVRTVTRGPGGGSQPRLKVVNLGFSDSRIRGELGSGVRSLGVLNRRCCNPLFESQTRALGTQIPQSSR